MFFLTWPHFSDQLSNPIFCIYFRPLPILSTVTSIQPLLTSVISIIIKQHHNQSTSSSYHTSLRYQCHVIYVPWFDMIYMLWLSIGQNGFSACLMSWAHTHKDWNYSYSCHILSSPVTWCIPSHICLSMFQVCTSTLLCLSIWQNVFYECLFLVGSTHIHKDRNHNSLTRHTLPLSASLLFLHLSP